MRVETPLFDGLPIGVVTSSVDCNRYLLNAAYWLAAAASSCFVGKIGKTVGNRRAPHCGILRTS